MIIRQVDESGDILPVLSSAAPVRGAPAAALLIRERLDLLTGEWWEYPDRGNGILAMLQEARPTEADRQAMAVYLTSYIRETPGVREIRDVSFTTEARQFAYSCTVETADGSASIHYEF